MVSAAFDVLQFEIAENQNRSEQLKTQMEKELDYEKYLLREATDKCIGMCININIKISKEVTQLCALGVHVYCCVSSFENCIRSMQ